MLFKSYVALEKNQKENVIFFFKSRLNFMFFSIVIIHFVIKSVISFKFAGNHVLLFEVIISKFDRIDMA